MNLINEAARICQVGAGFPSTRDGLSGRVIFWASHVTRGNALELLRCLALLGLSRAPWREIETPVGTMRRADLSDLDGEVRGEVIVNADGTASASLENALNRPPICITADVQAPCQESI
jgi:hypothetical protein